MFYIGLYRENVKKILLVQNHKAWSLNIWYLTSPNGLQIMTLRHKLGPPGGHMFCRGPSRENMKKKLLV